MNKFFTKIAGLSLGLAMAIGVGVAVGSKEAKSVSAAEGDKVSFLYTTSSSKKFNTAYGANTLADDNISGLSVSCTTAKTKGSGVIQNTYSTSFGGQQMTTNANRDTTVTFTFGNPWSGTHATYKEYTQINSVTFTAVAGSSTSYNVACTIDGVAATGDHSGFNATKTTCTFTPASGHKKGIIVITVSYSSGSKGWYFDNLGINAEVPAASKTLSSISLDTSSVKTTFTTGDTFTYSGLVVTANYSDSTSSTVTPTSVSTPSMSTSGQKTVTVSYTEGGVTKTNTYTITVNDPRTVSSLIVLDENAVELNDGAEVNLVASSGSSISTDVTCEVTYSPSGSDGDVTITSAAESGFNVTTADNITYTLTFTANGDHEITIAATEDDSVAITVTYHVSGLPNITYVTDTIDNALTGVGTVTTYTSWSDKSDQSDAVYAGKSAGSNATVQLRTSGNDEGVVTTTSAGGVVTVITITFNDNTSDSRKVDVYGKNTAYSAASDLFNNSNQGTLIGSVTYDKNGSGETVYTIDVSSDETKQFSFIGFRSNSSALYLDSIEITWAIEQEIIDTLESIEIDGSLTTSTYIEGQTISLEGLTVYGNYTHAGQVSLMGKAGLTFGSSPETATSTSLDEITVSASYEGKNASETYGITVSADSVTSLGWNNRGYDSGAYFLSGKTLLECMDTSKWTFSPVWASGLDKPEPSFGTGANDVHVGLYSTPTPSSETATALTNSYVFTTDDDGKYLVAFYEGVHSGSNRQLFITESLNSIVKPAEGDPGYFLVKDASNLSAGDTVVIASFNYDYAMSTTQNNNNRGSDSITKDSTDSSMSFTTSIQTFTLEAGTVDDTWAFKTSEGYIYAASSGSNYLRTKAEKDANCSFALTIANTGSAGAVAQGTNTRNVLSFNNSNNPKIFSCYGSLQSSGQLAIYKYTEPMDEPINNLDLKVQHVVVEYAKAFNSALSAVCVAYGSTDTDDLSEAWSAMDTQFTNWFNGSAKELTSDEKDFAKALFANAKYTVRESASNDSLQAMLGKYDEILSHYELDDFLKDDAGRSAAQKARLNPFGVIATKSGTTIAIVIISAVSLAAVGGYFLFRKKKEN